MSAHSDFRLQGIKVCHSKDNLIRELNPVIFHDEEEGDRTSEMSGLLSQPREHLQDSRKFNLLSHETDLDKYFMPNKDTFDPDQCNCVISREEVVQAEAEIKQEILNREFEIKNEPDRYKRQCEVPEGEYEEAVYAAQYQAVGVQQRSTQGASTSENGDSDKPIKKKR